MWADVRCGYRGYPKINNKNNQTKKKTERHLKHNKFNVQADVRCGDRGEPNMKT